MFFKRQDPGKQSCAVPQPLVPAPAPGVVPPPAAPTYTMRPPEGGTSVVAEKLKTARGVQESVQERVRIAVQRAKATVAPTNDVDRRPARQSTPATLSTPFPTQELLASAQAGLLNVARTWREADAPIRAIHAYVELLTRYPETPAAAAAVTDLVELSEKFAAEGQLHAAFGIYEYLEDLL